MAGAVLSDDWYRVAGLRPSLRASVRVARHRYRGRTWYVLLDPVSGRHYRVNRIAYQLLARLNGSLTVDQAWSDMMTRLGDEAPSQPEVMQALAQLHEANLLASDETPDAGQTDLRARQARRRRLLGSVNPLSFRIGLFDPSRLLERLAPVGRALFGATGAKLWLVLVLLGLVTAATTLGELTARTNELWQSSRFLLITWLVYPVLKGCHELAHALAVRRFGGEVREMGLRMLVLMPVPYVDASAATMFADKRLRTIVAGAGIAAELGLAAIAMLVWPLVEDGVVREVALATIVIGSLSTLVFNGNPLLRFDGYYMLSDWFELPNLATRASRQWVYLAQRYLLGMRSALAPAAAPGERRWLVGYGAAAWCYRVFVFLAISLFLADVHWMLGVLMLLTGLWTIVVAPGWRALDFVICAPALSGARPRAVGVTAAGLVGTVLAVVLIPLPSTTVAEGIVWLPDDARVRALAPGFVDRLMVGDGEQVREGQPLLRLRNEVLEAELVRNESELRVLETERIVAMESDPLRMAELEERITAAAAAVRRTRTLVDALVLRAGIDGRLALTRAADLPERHVAQGEVVGHILGAGSTTVRVALANEDAPRVRAGLEAIDVRLSEARWQAVAGRLKSDTPAATTRLPSAALGQAGGGRIAVDPQAGEGEIAVRPVYLFDVELPGRAVERAGARALVRFDHGAESLASLVARETRLLFLRHFDR